MQNNNSPIIKDKNIKEQEYDQRLIDVARVVRVMAGGRRFRFRTTVVIGDKRGKVGVGIAKGSDVTSAVEKAVVQAKKSLIMVPIKDGTIAHEVTAKYSSAKIMLKPGRKGKGIVAGGAMRVVCELAGLENVVGKIIGRTRNKINNARATLKALSQLKS